MADGILTGDDCSVFQTGSDVMHEIADDGRDDSRFGLIDSTDKSQQVNGTLEAPRKEAGACEEEVSNSSRLEIERVIWRSGTLEDFQV